MTSQKKTAHLAGLIYLIIVVSGIVSLLYVPNELYDWKDAAKTVQNIDRSKALFKVGAVSGVICYVGFVFLPLVLYRLLHKVGKTYATVMVVLALVSVPISLVAISNLFNVLDFLGGSSHYTALPENYLQAEVMASLNAYYNGIHISQVFWGLWLFPFGYLVYHSGFLPKFFGIFLMLGCFGYLADFMGATFHGNYYSTLFHELVGIPSTIGEIGICLWLSVFGDGRKISLPMGK